MVVLKYFDDILILTKTAVMEMAKKLDEEHIIRAVREGILDHVSGYHFLELIFRDFHKNNSSHKLMAVGVISYVLHP